MKTKAYLYLALLQAREIANNLFAQDLFSTFHKKTYASISLRYYKTIYSVLVPFLTKLRDLLPFNSFHKSDHYMMNISEKNFAVNIANYF